MPTSSFCPVVMDVTRQPDDPDRGDREREREQKTSNVTETDETKYTSKPITEHGLSELRLHEHEAFVPLHTLTFCFHHRIVIMHLTGNCPFVSAAFNHSSAANEVPGTRSSLIASSIAKQQ